MIRKLLEAYFVRETNSGLCAYNPKPKESIVKFRADLFDKRLLKQSDISKCFDIFGKHAATAKMALYLLIIDNASPTEIASRLKRQNYKWKRALNSKNIHIDIKAMELAIEMEARKKRLI